MYVFNYKQKTASEMRIGDWSSDLCSSDLDDKQVCFASYERDITSLIDPAHVSRYEITLAKFGGGLFGHAPIAFEHIGAPYLDNPDLARRQDAARRGIRDADFDAGQRQAHRSGNPVPVKIGIAHV